MNFLEYLYTDGVFYEYLDIDARSDLGLIVKARVKPVDNLVEQVAFIHGGPTKFRRDVPITDQHLIPFVEISTDEFAWNPKKYPEGIAHNGKISVIAIETCEVLFTECGFTVDAKLKQWLEDNRELLLNYWYKVEHPDKGWDYWIEQIGKKHR